MCADVCTPDHGREQFSRLIIDATVPLDLSVWSCLGVFLVQSTWSSHEKRHRLYSSQSPSKTARGFPVGLYLALKDKEVVTNCLHLCCPQFQKKRLCSLHRIQGSGTGKLRHNAGVIDDQGFFAFTFLQCYRSGSAIGRCCSKRNARA